MTKQHIARLLTLALLGGALAFVILRNRPDLPAPAALPAAGESPVQDAVYAMFDAAKQGNATAYIDAYAGALKTAIEQSRAEQGSEKFAAYLREQTQSVKGLALQEPQRLTEAQAKIQVEYIYQDRNETQWLTLDQLGAGWKITRIEAAQRIRTLVPYGTPVN